jgi:hypothetical protein
MLPQGGRGAVGSELEWWSSGAAIWECGKESTH